MLDQRHSQPHIVIIGGGITGLSAAYALQQPAGTGDALRYTLVERAPRLGGKIRTDVVEHAGRFVVEAGPDSLLAQKPWGVGLARELGLGDAMIGNNRVRKAVYVLTHGRPERMPEGLSLIVPTNLAAFARSRLLSPLGRLRAMLEPLVPARRDNADEALGDFIRRRFGREALERMAEPLMAGIHNAEIGRQSILSTFPRFHAIERTQGSLIRALRAERRQAKPSAASPFVSFNGGLQQLVDTLAAQLTGRILTNTGVQAITRSADGATYSVLLSSGEILDADALIVTTPAFVAAELLADMQPALASMLRAIRYVSTATISLAFRKSEVGEPIDGSGLLIPRVERRQINALTMSSIKYAGRAPDDAVLIRVFAGGSHNPGVLQLDDEALLATVRNELRELIGITAIPLFSRIYRWNQANPQYDVGHLDRVAAMEALCPDRLYLAGCAFRGVGIPDCIQQGQAVAQQALAAMASKQAALASYEQ